MKKVLGSTPLIGKNTNIVDSKFGQYVEIGEYNDITESFLDDYSYTSQNCQIIYSQIGKFVNIASFVRLNPGQHPKEWACQHHMLYRKEMYGFGLDDEEFFEQRRKKQVMVGHDVWIGHGVTIMGGISIANGAVIGSGAIVTKDVPAYSVVVGNPAKIIKFRFDSKTIDKLEEIQWWNWDRQKIKNSLEEFKNIETFVKKHA